MDFCDERLVIMLHFQKDSQLFSAENNDLLSLYEVSQASVGPEWNYDGSLACSNFHHLNIIYDGSGYWRKDNIEIKLEPGGIYWAPANSVIARECPESLSLFCLVFSFELFPTVDLLSKWTAPVKIGEWDIRHAARWQEQGVSRIDLAYLKGMINYHICNYCGKQLINELHEQEITLGRMKDVFEYVRDHLDAKTRVVDLAEIANMERCSFSRVFAQKVKMSPKQFLKEELNRRAEQLLLNPNLKVKDIADLLNFSDEYYFNRFFKEMNKIPPGVYREQRMNIGQ